MATIRPLISLKAGDRNITVRAVLTSVGVGQATRRGQIVSMLRGRLRDATGETNVTFWDVVPVKVGDMLVIREARVTEYKGLLTLSVERADLVEGGSLETNQSSAPLRLGQVEPGTIATVRVRLIEVNVKTVVTDGQERIVSAGIIADESGKAMFIDWTNRPMPTGIALELQDITSRLLHGLQINIQPTSVVREIPDEDLPSITTLSEGKLIGRPS